MGLERLRVSANVWDSDRNPKGYQTWAQNVSAMVAVLKNGAPLEAWLDKTLDRKREQSMITPSFLLDESWDYSDKAGSPPRSEERAATIQTAAADAAAAIYEEGGGEAAADGVEDCNCC